MTTPRPYYERNGITIYHGDCCDVLPTLEPGSVVITDPPYGFGKYQSDTNVFRDLLSVLVKRFRTVVCFGFPEVLVDWCIHAGSGPNEWITWWPTNKAGSRSTGLPHESEAIAIFGNLPGAQLLFRPRSADAKGRSISQSRGLDTNWARMGDVWRDPSPGMGFNSHLRQHPNAKPLSLMLRLVTLCSESGDTILDPFMGSGTTLRAAKDLGRKAIGIEVEEKYCQIAAQRLEQEVMDMEVPA